MGEEAGADYSDDGTYEKPFLFIIIWCGNQNVMVSILYIYRDLYDISYVQNDQNSKVSFSQGIW